MLDEFISIDCSLFIKCNLPKNHPRTDMLTLETISLATPFSIHFATTSYVTIDE